MSMYSRGKSGPVPSDAQAREKLIVYVYEYLHHAGAPGAAEKFLQEIQWAKGQITPNEAPGFLHSWWCVFWDLYCAAPERRDNFPHSKEASSFHDYSVMTSTGYPMSPNLNGMGMPPGAGQPPHHPHNMGEGGPGAPSPSLHQLTGSGPDGGMPPGFFPGSHLRPSPSQMMSHPGMPMMPLSGPPPQSGLQQHPGQQQGPIPRGYAPTSNRSSPARMTHPGQQQMEFAPPPGAIMMSADGVPMSQAMMMSRGRGPGMPASPMGAGGYVGGGPGGGPMQRMQHPGSIPGGSPAGANMAGLPPMHQQQQQQRQQWQHGGPMGHYSTPSPPNGPYMGMMGPPSHMQSPSQESVLQGQGENIYGMMKGPVTDRFGHPMNDGSMGGLVPVDMGNQMNGDSMELKHSPSINGNNDPNGNRNPNPGMDNVVDEYSFGQLSAAAAAASASSQE